jgi:ABC-type sugar transport system substrate-binding protein
MKKLLIMITVFMIVAAVGASFVLAGSKEKAPAGGKEWNIVYVAKLIGIPWFNVTEEGILAASKQYGVKGSLVGPPVPDPAQQARVVEDWWPRAWMRSASRRTTPTRSSRYSPRRGRREF